MNGVTWTESHLFPQQALIHKAGRRVAGERKGKDCPGQDVEKHKGGLKHTSQKSKKIKGLNKDHSESDMVVPALLSSPREVLS